MKKIIYFLMAIVCVFTVAACTTEELTVTVKFETNGGTAISDLTISEQNIATTVLPETTKEGFEFDGWYLNSELTSDYNTSALTNALESGSLTVYAKWEAISVEPEETIAGTWTAAGMTLKLNDDNTATINMLGQSLEGTYTVDETGKFALTISYLGAAMEINGTYADGTLSVTFEGQSLSFTKSEPITLPEVSGPIDVTVTFSGLLAMTVYSVSDGVTESNPGSVAVDVTVNVKVEEMKVEKIEDLKASINATVKLTPTGSAAESIEEMELAVKLYVANGTAIVEIPGFIMESEAETVQVKIDLTKIIDAVKEMASQAGDFSLEEVLAMVQMYIMQFQTKISELGLEEIVAEGLEIVSGLISTPTVEGGKTTYTITDEQVKVAANAIAKLIEDNFDVIYPLTLDTDEDGNVFIRNQLFWTDANGVKHEFSEDYETENYGYTYTKDGVEVYTPYTVSGYFIIETGEFVPDSYYEEPETKESVLAEFKEDIAMILSFIKLNKLSFGYTLAEEKLTALEFVFDMELDTKTEGESFYFDLQAKVDLDVAIAYDAVTCEVIVEDAEALDVTDMIISAIKDQVDPQTPTE